MALPCRQLAITTNIASTETSENVTEIASGCQISLTPSADSLTRSARPNDSLTRSAAEVFNGALYALGLRFIPKLGDAGRLPIALILRRVQMRRPLIAVPRGPYVPVWPAVNLACTLLNDLTSHRSDNQPC
jgi:hypothetical protein